MSHLHGRDLDGWIESIRPPSPDQRVVDEADLWDPQAGAWVPRPSALWALLVGLVAGVFAGILLVLIIVQALAAHG